MNVNVRKMPYFMNLLRITKVIAVPAFCYGNEIKKKSMNCKGNKRWVSLELKHWVCEALPAAAAAAWRRGGAARRSTGEARVQLIYNLHDSFH